LVPTTEFVPADYIQRKRLRRDKRRCTPGILTVNRQIHDEVEQEWYSTTQYEVKIGPKGIGFLGRRVGLGDKNLDHRLGWIRNMRLFVELLPYPLRPFGRSGIKLPEVSRIYTTVMQSLIQHLLSLPNLRLRCIDLVVAMTDDAYTGCVPWDGGAERKDSEKNILAVLQNNFDVDFFDTKGVAIWRSWKFDYSQPALEHDWDKYGQVEEHAEQFEKIAIPYFEHMVKKVNPLKTDFSYLGKIKVVPPWVPRTLEDLYTPYMFDPFD
jgi:hypothetical protein